MASYFCYTTLNLSVMITEILKGYERKGPLGVEGSLVLITTNAINYFFGAMGILAFIQTGYSGNTDQALAFFLIGVTHFLNTCYKTKGLSVLKRFVTLSSANIFALLLGFAFNDMEAIQTIFYVLLAGLSFLLFNTRQSIWLTIWFIIPVGAMTSLGLITSQNTETDGIDYLHVVLGLSGLLAILLGLSSVVVKVRQIQHLLSGILEGNIQDTASEVVAPLSAKGIKKIKTTLDEKENFYKLLATYSKDIILLFDPTGTIQYISPSVEKILGYTPDSLMGRNINAYANITDLVYAAEENQEIQVKTKFGTKIWLEGKIQRILNEAGKHIQTHAILRDVTKDVWLESVLRQSTQLAKIGGWETDIESGRSTCTQNLPSLFGFEAGEEFSQNSILQKISPKTAAALLEAYENALAYGEKIDQQIALNNSLGEQSWIRVVVHPELRNGKVVKIIGSVIDINERKTQERALDELAMVARYSSSATVITDKNKHILWVNEAFMKMTGYSMGELVGKNPGKILQGRDSSAEVVKQMSDALYAGHGFYGELVNYGKNKKPYWVAINVNPVFNENGEIIKFIAIENDISHRKNSEKELKIAKKNAEEASVAKEQFLATMTHEIRTPLNAVIGMSKILMDENPRQDQMDLLRPLHYSAENLLTLINDILDFTKMSSEKIEFEAIPFRINEEMEKMVSSMKFKAREKGNELVYEGDKTLPGLLAGDKHRIHQVLNNLIGNAAKFTENGRIRVSCKPLTNNQHTQWVRFAVADTGIGLAPEKVKYIFEKFSQADASTARKFGGTGLGLAISKMIVEQQGGKIWVESKLGEGSTFYFDLPLKMTQYTETSEKAIQPVGSLGHLHVLAVDDNQINQLVLERFLKKWKVTFKQAYNGSEAIEWAAKEKFDIILMDLEMPSVDGYNASRKIRTSGSFNIETPIIALTASTRQEVESRVFDAGMNDVMMKPFNPMNLYQMLVDYSIPAHDLGHVA